MISTAPRSKIIPSKLKSKLDPLTFHVTQEKGTEAPFSGKYAEEHSSGIYKCTICGADLFSSTAKFDSKTGWPSFDEPMNLENIELKDDDSHGMHRTEVACKKCGAHLGHLFDDGPTQTGQRYCINSCALNLEKNEKNP